ncbi:MAG: hypothetical protein SGJ01_08035 [Gemmatimonadota bacterium]|nr:hypothetical protein [Gemmatimonadota bacterium]
MPALWSSRTIAHWKAALDSYDEVIARQGVAKLEDRDRWYRDELPDAINARRPRHVIHPELVRLTEWKMSRGKWRAPNLILVKGNTPALVKATTTAGLALVPDPTAPIAKIAELAGVGPATASAILSAAEPGLYPFFDELVAAQIPGLGPVAFTLSYYRRYAEALRERTTALGGKWTVTMVERALWAVVGGKAGLD